MRGKSGVLLKSLPTKSSEKENQESLQASDSLWVFMHVNAVCVFGELSIRILTSLSTSTLVQLCYKVGTRRTRLQQISLEAAERMDRTRPGFKSRLSFTSSEMLDNLLFHLFGQ